MTDSLPPGLSDGERALLRQAAVSLLPMTPADLIGACGQGDESQVDRLVDSALLSRTDDGEVIVPDSVAEALRSDDDPERHRRAIDMRFTRFEENRGTLADLVEIARHHVALFDTGAMADFALDVADRLGDESAATFLSEVVAWVPETDRDYLNLGERLAEALVATGELDAALARYELVREAARRIAEADPADTQAQRDLSRSHDYLGDLAMHRGDAVTAEAAFRESMAIRQRLSTTDPDVQRELGISYGRLGDLAIDVGDLDAAESSHRSALAIAERLAAADPADAQAQVDLSLCLLGVGEVAMERLDLSTAEKSYRDGLAIAERLLAADPTDVQAQEAVELLRERVRGFTDG
jgi:tetratricopeptide (TPR) repeat protein